MRQGRPTPRVRTGSAGARRWTIGGTVPYFVMTAPVLLVDGGSWGPEPVESYGWERLGRACMAGLIAGNVVLVLLVLGAWLGWPATL